jgi:hypothetical protein
MEELLEKFKKTGKFIKIITDKLKLNQVLIITQPYFLINKATKLQV